MKIKTVFFVIFFNCNLFAIPWATNDKNDPSGFNNLLGSRDKPKLEKHENYCFNQFKKIDFIGSSYDVKKVGKKSMSNQETISYYEVREFKKQNDIKILVRKRFFSCMHGLDSFNNNKPLKRKLIKLNNLPKGIEEIN